MTLELAGAMLTGVIVTTKMASGQSRAPESVVAAMEKLHVARALSNGG